MLRLGLDIGGTKIEAPYLFSDRCITPIVPARHGDSSGVRGAAWLPAKRRRRSHHMGTLIPSAQGGYRPSCVIAIAPYCRCQP